MPFDKFHADALQDKRERWRERAFGKGNGGNNGRGRKLSATQRERNIVIIYKVQDKVTLFIQREVFPTVWLWIKFEGDSCLARFDIP